jgi:hypothetical protein
VTDDASQPAAKELNGKKMNRTFFFAMGAMFAAGLGLAQQPDPVK